MNRIVFVLGGARSGKSSFAEDLAREIKTGGGYRTGIAFLATGVEVDEEFKKRIERHRERRTSEFETYEESIDIAGKLAEVFERHQIFIIDCLSTWLGNIFMKMNEAAVEDFVGLTLEKIDKIFKGRLNPVEYSGVKEMLQAAENKTYDTGCGRLLYPGKEDKTLLVVSNDVGQGIVPGDHMTRLYRDIHGRMNRKMASLSDYVYLMNAGIPARLS